MKSFPFTKSPASAFHGSHESPRSSQLEIGDQFTRQSSFLDNVVVPTDRCDDPSFFSGLSVSNTPETSQTRPDEKEDVDSDEEAEEDDIYFEPIVQLPTNKVEFKSGEEDEDVVFEQRAKLFRFDSGTKEWKERGTGNIKLLYNPQTGMVRILMRREKVHKVCANHFLTPDMTLQPGKGSTKSWVWSTIVDSSDEEARPEQFAAKFETEEIAEAFKAKFEEMQLEKPCGPPHLPVVSSITTVTNDKETQPLISENMPYMSSTPSRSNPFIVPRSSKVTFDVISPLSSPTSPNKFTFSTGTFAKEIKPPLDTNLPFSFPSLASPAPVSTQLFSFSENEYQKSSNTKPFQFPQFSSLGTSDSFQAQVQPGLFQPQNTERMSTFSFTFPGKQESSLGSALLTEKASETSSRGGGNSNEEITQEGNTTFGKSTKESVGDKAFVHGSSANSKGFTEIGKQIFTQPDNERVEDEEQENEDNIDFKPIVSLPLVKHQLTGEEGETVRFCNKAKLLRFDSDTKEWKERGIGEIKLLFNAITAKSRVVMRREQVHKLCANHVILSNMKLEKASETSPRSWLWYTPADFSDGEPKAGNLAVRFKLQETATEFKKVFEELQSITAMSKDFDLCFQKLHEDAGDARSQKPQKNTGSTDFTFNSQKPKEDVSSSFAFGSQNPKEDIGSSPFIFNDGASGFNFNDSSSGFNFTDGSSVFNVNDGPSGFNFNDGSSGFVFGSQKPIKESGETDFTSSTTTDKPGFPKQHANTADLKSIFQPAKGSWECEACFVRNTEQAIHCVACQTPKLGTQTNVPPSGKPTFTFKTNDPTSTTGFTFGSPLPSKDSAKSVQDNKKSVPTGFTFPGAVGEDKTTTTSLKSLFQPAEGSWKCEVCLVGNTKQAVHCVACQTPKPGAGANSTQNNVPPSGRPTFTFKTNDPSSTTGFTFGSPLPSKDSAKSVEEIKESAPTGFTFPGAVGEDKTTTTSLKSLFQPAEGSWKCEVCLVGNTKQAVHCVACQTPKPGAGANSTGFTFGSPLPSKDSAKSAQDNNEPGSTGFTFPGAADKTTTTLVPAFTFGFSTPNKEVPEGVISEGRSADKGTFVFGTPGQNRESNKTAFTFGFQEPSNKAEGFGLEAQAPGNKPNKTDFTFLSNKTEPMPVSKPFFNYGYQVPIEESGDTDRIDEAHASTALKLKFQAAKGSWQCDECLVRNDEQAVHCVACQTVKPSANASRQPNIQDFSFEKQSNVVNLAEHDGFKFHLELSKDTAVPCSTKSTTSSSGKQPNNEEENPEKEDDNLVFKPMVSLPQKVHLKIGEEDEMIKFFNHAKLYRFDDGSWKERGVGEIKVLYDIARKRGRVVMRRDQVRVLCANHFISSDMVLKPHGDSQKCWMWHVAGDTADNETKEQLFAVKFKDSEIAIAFKDAFEGVRDERRALENSGQNDDEVEVVCEITASQDQHGRADKLLLPRNFYVCEKQVKTDGVDVTSQSILKKDGDEK